MRYWRKVQRKQYTGEKEQRDNVKEKEKDKVIHNWEKEGISVLKGKWGRFNVIKGKQKIELPKTTDAPALTLEDVKAMFDNKSKKKAKK